jgi:hypothetical protein
MSPLKTLQHIVMGGHANCVQLCEWLQPWPQILPDVLFMDEDQFSQTSITNTWNSLSWAQENPHKVAQCHFQHQFSVNMWDRVLVNNLMGSHLIEEHLISPYNRNFLKNELALY